MRAPFRCSLRKLIHRNSSSLCTSVRAVDATDSSHAKQVGVLCLALVVMAFGVTACSSTSHKRGTSTVAQVQTVSVAYSGSLLNMAPYYVAEAKGYFRQEKIRIKPIITSNVFGLLPLLSKDQINLDYIGTSPAFFNAVNSGLHIVAIADRLQYKCSSDAALLVRSSVYNSGVTSTKGLSGRSVAILGNGTTMQYWLDTTLTQAGLPLSAPSKVVTLNFSDMLTALRTGAIDYAYDGEPLDLEAVKAGYAKILEPISSIVPNEEVGLWVASDQFARADGGRIAARWLIAWLKGVRYEENPNNKASTVAIVSRLGHFPETLVKQLYLTTQWPWARPNGTVDVHRILSMDAAWALKNHLIAKIPPTSRWYNSSPVTLALNDIGRVSDNRDCATVPSPSFGG